MQTLGYGAPSANDPLQPLSFDRIDPRPGEIGFEVLYCGVCHSDVHQVNNDWQNTVYPCVPGHEVIGRVTQVGEGVTKFSEGDLIGVGCMVNSCQTCQPCREDEEQYCNGPKSATLTYNGPLEPDGSNTYGGYSTHMVVREAFGLRIPEAIDPRDAGPILCAGITTYSPMRHWQLERGQTLGVAGIGGLGHMAVQIGKALGAKVVAFTGHAHKRQAILDLGADEVVLHTDPEQMQAKANSIDLLINTIPYPFDLEPYIGVMKKSTTIVVVGNFIEFPAFSPGDLVFKRVQVAGSLIGGVRETQEVLDLCAEHGIRPNTKLIEIDQVNDVFAQLRHNRDDDFRHVIDMQSLRRKAVADATIVEAPDRGEPVNRDAA